MSAPFRVSMKAANVAALNVAILQPDPSATTWSRLDPMPTSDDTTLGLQAPLADPLWMLARQWQFNEFQGEDAGSPIGAAMRVRGAPISRLVHAGGAMPDRAFGGATSPLEAIVEAERVLPVHAKLNAQAGQHLMRMLRAAGQGGAVDPLRAAFTAAIADPADPVADNAGFVWHRLLGGRAIDADGLARTLRPLAGNDAAIEAVVAGLGIAAPAAVRAVLSAWLAWLDDLVVDSDTAGASAYWNPQRLEYAFGLRSDGVVPEVRLDADEFTDGLLDWHTFTARAPSAGIPPMAQGATEWKPERPPMPTIARYPGMPADRYWEFEDGQVNFGRLGAAKSDLARLAVMEYALVFGNDWFVLPMTLPTNAVYRVAEFSVTDNFGITVPIPPARNSDGTPWTLFGMSSAPAANGTRTRLDGSLYLCPALETQEGPALEHVLMMRDEMANIAWAIEKRVQGTSGDALDRGFESGRLSTTQRLALPSGAVVAEGGAPLSYTLQTPVAAHWIPFLPVKREHASALNWSIQLQRGVVTQFYQVTPGPMDEPRNVDYKAFIERLRNLPFVEPKPVSGPDENKLQGFMFHPRGEILRLTPGDPASLTTTDFLRLEEEEVPREGIELKRAFNYARDASGRALLWIGRSKTTGRGEGASGLKFDVVK
jgi:hypothetical protein